MIQNTSLQWMMPTTGGSITLATILISTNGTLIALDDRGRQLKNLCGPIKQVLDKVKACMNSETLIYRMDRQGQWVKSKLP